MPIIPNPEIELNPTIFEIADSIIGWEALAYAETHGRAIESCFSIRTSCDVEPGDICGRILQGILELEDAEERAFALKDASILFQAMKTHVHLQFKHGSISRGYQVFYFRGIIVP